jgi:cytidylate kinase
VKVIVIAIDGPAGSGKSTLARALARRLGYCYLDTGAMYRAAAWKLDRLGVPVEEGSRLRDAMRAIRIDLENEGDRLRVLVDGEDVTTEIRIPTVAMLASRYSALPAVRRGLTELQRSWRRLGGVVAEGRDTTTVVFPDADLKVYLDATPAERARRRLWELRTQGVEGDVATIRQEIEARDRADATRVLAPLARAPDALYIDTTGLPVEDVVERLVREVERRLCCTGS